MTAGKKDFPDIIYCLNICLVKKTQFCLQIIYNTGTSFTSSQPLMYTTIPNVQNLDFLAQYHSLYRFP